MAAKQRWPRRFCSCSRSRCSGKSCSARATPCCRTSTRTWRSNSSIGAASVSGSCVPGTSRCGIRISTRARRTSAGSSPRCFIRRTGSIFACAGAGHQRRHCAARFSGGDVHVLLDAAARVAPAGVRVGGGVVHVLRAVLSAHLRGTPAQPLHDGLGTAAVPCHRRLARTADRRVAAAGRGRRGHANSRRASAVRLLHRVGRRPLLPPSPSVCGPTACRRRPGWARWLPERSD